MMPYPQRMRRFIALLAAAILLFAGCQVTEDLSIAGEGGTSHTDIHVEQFFIDVLSDFAEFLPAGDEPMMDAAIRGYASDLEKSGMVSGVEWESLGDNSYTLSFSYASLNDLLETMGAEDQSLFALTDHSLSLHLDIDSYPQLKSLVPFLSDPNFEVYGPEYNQGMSEADYLDMIYFLLGEDGPDAVANGSVSVRINVPGTIVSASGCEIVADDAAIFSFPIIDFLLLNEPMAFSLEWE